MNQIEEQILPYCDHIQQSCEPLFGLLKINGFTFQRHYSDGSRIYFANSSAWAEHFIKRNYFSVSGYKKFSYLPKFTLWKHWPQKDKIFQSFMKDMKENFNTGNCLNIIKGHENYLDIFCLRAHEDDENVNNSYLNHIADIENFLNYLVVRISPLIEKAEKNRIFVKEDKVNINFDPKIIFKDPHKSNENEDIKNNRILIRSFPNKVYLSKQESLCIIYSLRGKPANQIAQLMGISPRTVESYLKNIKLKLGMNKKEKVFEYILGFEYNRNIIYCY